MDRKEYWENGYMEYFRAITEEAEQPGDRTKVAKIQEGDFKTPNTRSIENILDILQYRKSDRILDYGCGIGRFYKYISEKGDYYGIDIAEAMINECHKRYPEKSDRFIVAEGENLPFEDSFFDKIICYGVLDACYQEKALAEMFRVLKAGGGNCGKWQE